ncbi:2-C-methyl-D-erythritol 2,4-cyclodiphosphate synthase [Umboniibacter marinipuniceus]|uniref:2-C-methyl-D-erythritol 2,4-cyclodiphosphate synthase n=1 Tax=Umboniibacter marinipuniceus TaxID=569599 RepID=A0A3M0A8F4_9GAMM|nr:2-C-methyl-D-erythritol 2,4-cyclodiphosphate synthase [Umboniibacter marinipuniceus]RMA78695.1 2-C-methyl-D-erythritol 2,4-cyclodiphosphate synthase [Umboniibacter marinipuniceus]
MPIRIGHGYDVHRFNEGSFIMMAGVQIEHDQGFEAHSDGDVALHAITDAILGAAGLGDIGRHFPDTDQQWANADSADLLRAIWQPLLLKGYQIGNADITIVAQSPKMSPHIEVMEARLAAILECSVEQVNVKATTTEKLGFEGRKEGVAVHAVVLLEC